MLNKLNLNYFKNFQKNQEKPLMSILLKQDPTSSHFQNGQSYIINRNFLKYLKENG